MYNEKLKPNQNLVGATSSRPHFEGITKNHKGITLIALIITIIVMMILVAVSVTVALDGGLFSTAKKAASETELKAEEEMLLSAVVGAIGVDAKVDFTKIQLPAGFEKTGDKMYESSSGNAFFIGDNGEIEKISRENDTYGIIEVPYEEWSEELKAAKNEGKITKVLKEVKYGKEYRAVIPVGFEVSIKDDENTISGGLVVSDVNGNEFVWVPCTTDKNDETGLILYAQDKEVRQYKYKEYSDWTDEGGNSESVSKYGGFYVGRYEAGIPSNAPFYASADGDTYVKEGRNTTEYIPVSKPNNPSWNYISQTTSKIVSAAMYSSSVSVQSSLIDSYAWDTIVNWMESKEPTIVKDSSNYGNYLTSEILLSDAMYSKYIFDCSAWAWTSKPTKYQKGMLEVPAREWGGEQEIYELATGASNSTKVLNIYDMAGNLWEHTTEVGNWEKGSSAVQYVVTRGGSFYNGGADCVINYRYGSRKANDGNQFMDGFRVVLYIK